MIDLLLIAFGQPSISVDGCAGPLISFDFFCLKPSFHFRRGELLPKSNGDNLSILPN